MAATLSPDDRSWYIVGRWQEFEGEGRANLLRVVSLVVFYAVEWYQFAAAGEDSAAAQAFHRQTTLIVAAWSIVALAVLVCLWRRIFPAIVKYLSTAGDLLLLTLLARAGLGPESPLVHVYFLILVLAALRFSVGLIWFATVGSMACYWALVGMHDDTWFDAEHATPVVEQLVTFVSLALTGIVLGQAVRRVKSMAVEYAARVEARGRGEEGK
jgi:hypothetical protein